MINYLSVEGQPLLSALTVTGNVSVAFNSLFVDSINGFVGVNTNAPGAKLDVRAVTGPDIAMRITNTGSGASFLVEDSSSTDSTPFIIDGSGRVGIGTSTPGSTLEVLGSVFVWGSGSNITTRQASGNDGVVISGRAAGSSNYNITLTPTTLNTNRILTLPDATGTVITTGNLSDFTVTAANTLTAHTGVGYMGLPQNASTTGNYNIVAADAGKHIYSTATRIITIPANSNIAMPVGTTITFIAGGGATVTISITSDDMYLASSGSTGSRTLAQYGVATIVKVTSTAWAISGNGLT
jgi:hypothetical protein